MPETATAEDLLRDFSVTAGQIEYCCTNESIRFFEPNESQRPVMLCDAQIRIFAAPNQIGKTTLGVVEWVWHSMGVYPPWFPENLRMKPPVKIRVSGPDFQVWAQQTLEEKVNEIVPKHWIKRRQKNPQGVVVKYEFVSGSTWYVQTYEQKDQQFESAVYDGAWFDEPPPHGKFIGTMRGLVAKGGRVLMTATPIVEGPWLEELYEQSEDNPRIMWFTGDIEHNMPNLDKDNYDQWKALIPEHLRAARLYGQIVTLKDRIWPQFDENVHVCIPFEPSTDVTWFRMIDPHPRQPDCVSWAFCDSNDTVYIADEAQIDEPISKAGYIIKQRTRFEPRYTVMDPNAGKSPSGHGIKETVQQAYQKAGIAAICNINDDWHMGKKKIDEYLAYEKNPLDGTIVKQPKLLIFSNCTQHIRQFKRATYDPQSEHTREKRDPQSKPRAKDMHYCDNVRYLLMSKPHHWRPKPRERYGYKPRSLTAGY